MAVSCILSTFARNALANDTGLKDMLANGTCKLYTAANGGGTLLVTFTIPPPANLTIDTGILTIAGIANANGAANGTANYAQFVNAAANVIADVNVGIGSGYTINIDNNVIAVNQVCSVTSANFTVPAGT